MKRKNKKGVIERDSRKLIKVLKREGWVHVRTQGSHKHFEHPDRDNLVTVPDPKHDISIGTVRNIYRQAGWRK